MNSSFDEIVTLQWHVRLLLVPLLDRHLKSRTRFLHEIEIHDVHCHPSDSLPDFSHLQIFFFKSKLRCLRFVILPVPSFSLNQSKKTDHGFSIQNPFFKLSYCSARLPSAFDFPSSSNFASSRFFCSSSSAAVKFSASAKLSTATERFHQQSRFYLICFSQIYSLAKKTLSKM